MTLREQSALQEYAATTTDTATCDTELTVQNLLDRRDFLFGALAMAALPGVEAEPVSTDTARLMSEHLDHWEVFGFSGVASVLQLGKPLFSVCRGFADKSIDARFSRSTPFNIASMTKTFTAIAVLSLRDEGKLRLEDTISQHLQGVPIDKKDITLEQLLSHTAGLHRESIQDKENLSRDQAGARILSASVVQKPGEQFHYSNDGYKLLALIIENVCGMSYSAHIRRTIFKPAAMRASGFTQQPLVGAPPARGYNEWEELPSFASLPKEGWNDGAGNIVSTQADIESFIAHLTSGKIVKPSTLQQMQQPKAYSADKSEIYGYGWYISKASDGTPVILHGGDNVGYHTELRFYPSVNLWIFVATNTEVYDDSGTGVAVHKRILASDLWRLYKGSPVISPPGAKAVARDAEHTSCGVWFGAEGSSIEIIRRDTHDTWLRAVVHGQHAANALLELDQPAREHMARLNESATELASLISSAAWQPLKTKLRNLGYFVVSWRKDFESWQAAYGRCLRLGPFTTRPIPYDPSLSRTHFTFIFERKIINFEFSWRENELLESLSEREMPSSVILPVAGIDQAFATYDFVSRKSTRCEVSDTLRVGDTSFERKRARSESV